MQLPILRYERQKCMTKRKKNAVDPIDRGNGTSPRLLQLSCTQPHVCNHSAYIYTHAANGLYKYGKIEWNKINSST